MFFDFLFPKKNYIATLKFSVYWSDSKYYSHIFYILYETDSGKRSIDINTDNWLLDKRKKSNELYNSIIIPWMNGYYKNDEIIAYVSRNK